MVVATGFFDGVHLGHRAVIAQLVAEAKTRGCQSKVVTFWPHPRNVLQDGARDLRLLTTLAEKKQLLLSLGVDSIEVIPFTKDFSHFSTKEYFKQYLIDKFGAKVVLLGYDNRMGANANGVMQIAQNAKEVGLEVVIAKEYKSNIVSKVSSTTIRELISKGDVAVASKLLGYNYSLFGVVVSGNRIGRTIGFPTANMQLYEPLKLLPGRGVYLVKVYTLGKEFYGMCNIGYRPTISAGLLLTIETNIFNFTEDIYGLDLKIEFFNQIRGEIKFKDINDLQQQLQIDKQYCLNLVSKM